MNRIKKTEIRKSILKIRNSISLHQRVLRSEKILKKLYKIKEFKESKTILFYASFGSEVNTIDSIIKALSLSKCVILPKVDYKNKTLKLYQIEKIEDLKPGYKNILEPSEIKDKEVNILDIDLIIVPGTAFDLYGNRLGYGGGYYDVILSNRNKHTKTIALAFEEQILDLLPVEKHDIRVDVIITDKRIIRTK